MKEQEVKSKLKDVNFLLLQFIDLSGTLKNIEIPQSQFEKALENKIMFDGSSIEGYVKIQESDMYLKPDLSTFAVLPWKEGDYTVARLICDVVTNKGESFVGCPRSILKKMMARATAMGYETAFGPEAEFFLFEKDSKGPSLETHDKAGYFDLAPKDKGDLCRRDIVTALIKMGFEVEAAHHEVARGQHEIDFKYADALTTADNLATFRMVVRKIADIHGLYASFMPKPISGINGSGMHTHQSLFNTTTKSNAFYDGNQPHQLSVLAQSYLAGILAKARAFCAITNPIVNSFKRLVPGYEAPVTVAWSECNRSAMVRIPAPRGNGTRIELRMPDPSCNPYLAFAVMLGSGLLGIQQGLTPTSAVTVNLFKENDQTYPVLPKDLGEALEVLRNDMDVKSFLGEHTFNRFLEIKTEEWNEYIQQVSQWEVETYLTKF